MKLHILVEGPSEEVFLKQWLPGFIPQHTFNVLVHRGKGRLSKKADSDTSPLHQGLLDQLPAKLRAFGQTLNSATDRVLVLVDQDNDNCLELKQRLLEAYQACNPRPEAKFRIATLEMETFYLGERKAIRDAFPKARLRKMNNAEDPEQGTWEAFRKVIGVTGEDKVDWAKKMGRAMATGRPISKYNTSVSFGHFCQAILELVGELPS